MASSDRASHGGEIPALTMVRFLAAFGVLWFHSGRHVLSQGPLGNLVASGYVGVYFFFMLSGFVLTYAYHYRAPLRLRDFYVGRVARIYPTYVFAWLLFGICYVLQVRETGTPAGYAAKSATLFGGSSLLLIQTWIPGAAERWNWPGWSLSVEAVFYALFPLLLALSARWSISSLVRVLAISSIAYMGVQWADGVTLGQPFLGGTVLATTRDEFIGHLPILNLPVFVIGIALGRLYISGVRLNQPGIWLFAVSLVTSATLAAGNHHSHWGFLRRDFLFGPECAVLIYLLAQVRGDTSSWLKRFGMLLGRSSYALYIVQTPFSRFYERVGFSTSSTWTSLLTYTMCVVAFSIAVHLLIEIPAEKAIKKLYRRRAPPPPAGSVSEAAPAAARVASI